jgi:hypothetical protein
LEVPPLKLRRKACSPDWSIFMDFFIFRAVDQKHLESSEMLCWRRMEKIGWTDRVRSEEVLLRVKEQRNILHEISKRKANWIGHILRWNCLLRQVIEGKIQGGIEVTGKRGRRRMKLLDDIKERRGYSHLKEEVLDRTMWRAGFGRSFGLVLRQTAKWIINFIKSLQANIMILPRWSYCSFFRNHSGFNFHSRPIMQHYTLCLHLVLEFLK